MENWIKFPLFAITSAALWVAGLIFISIGFFKKDKPLYENLGIILSALGALVFAIFIGLLWVNLERPPLRTLGETRLWSTLFLATAGLIVYLRWRFILVYGYALMLAFVFLIINLVHPEIHEKALMPALQSPWFVPHVIVYMLAYALLGLSCGVGIYGLIVLSTPRYNEKIAILGDNMVYLGFAMLTCGLLFGAIWAKEAWGHYWTWDPKETWAFLTWLAYLVYLHYRHYYPNKVRTHLWILSISFIVLLICWFGINYLPSAQNSVHVYSN
jgi:ABC-type transport system involved in cytochrome c biogenesis permease subunit